MRGRLPVQCRCLCLPVQCSPQLLASTVLAAFFLASSPFFSVSSFFWGPARVFVLCLRLRSTKVAGHPLLHLGPRPGACICLLSSCSSLPGSALSLSLSFFFFVLFFFLYFFLFLFLSFSLFHFLASACLIRLGSMNTNCGNMAHRSFRLKGVQLEMSGNNFTDNWLVAATLS